MTFTRITNYPNIGNLARDKQRQLEEITRRVWRAEVEAVETLTPRDTGTLVNWLKQGEVVYGKRACIGPLEGTRHDMGAPPNTIQDFVATYGGNPGRPGGVLSWWTLPKAARDALRQARSGGLFGGPYPPPVYFGAVEKGLVPNRGNAKIAANVHFVRRIHDRIRSRIPVIVKDVVG